MAEPSADTELREARRLLCFFEKVALYVGAAQIGFGSGGDCCLNNNNLSEGTF